MTLAIFLFGALVTGLTVAGLLMIGIGEATDPAHGKADDAFTRFERDLSQSLE